MSRTKEWVFVLLYLLRCGTSAAAQTKAIDASRVWSALPNLLAMAPSPGTPALTPAQVRAEIRDRLVEALGERLWAIYLFGSRVKGTARARSDWDVAIVLREPVEDWAEARLSLARLFYECPFAVDLHVFGLDEFSLDQTVPGTLASIVARRSEPLLGPQKAA
jgi:predicted nucleotidyltransferase